MFEYCLLSDQSEVSPRTGHNTAQLQPANSSGVLAEATTYQAFSLATKGALVLLVIVRIFSLCLPLKAFCKATKIQQN